MYRGDAASDPPPPGSGPLRPSQLQLHLQSSQPPQLSLQQQQQQQQQYPQHAQHHPRGAYQIPQPYDSSVAPAGSPGSSAQISTGSHATAGGQLQVPVPGGPSMMHARMYTPPHQGHANHPHHSMQQLQQLQQQQQQQMQHHAQQQQQQHQQLHQQRISSLPAFVSPSTAVPARQASSSNGIGPPPHGSYGPGDARSLHNSPVMVHPSLQRVAMVNGSQIQLQQQQQQQQHHPQTHPAGQLGPHGPSAAAGPSSYATRASPSPAKQQYHQIQHEHQQQLQPPSSPHYASHHQPPQQQQQQQQQQPVQQPQQAQPQRLQPGSAAGPQSWNRPVSPVDGMYHDKTYVTERDGRLAATSQPASLVVSPRPPPPAQPPSQPQPHHPNSHTSSEQAQAQDQQSAPLGSDDLRPMFHSYIFDYLQKSGLHTAAHAFLRDVPTTPIRPLGPGQVHPASYKGKGHMHESGPSGNSPEIDPQTIPQANVQIESPAGFLFEWWTIFYEVFRQRAGPNGVLSSHGLVDMSHHAIDVGTRNSSGPPRGSTPMNSHQQSPRRVTAVPPGPQQQQYQQQQQHPPPAQYQGNFAGQPSPHPSASAANPTSGRQPPPPQRITVAPGGSYGPSQGGPRSGSGPNSNAYSVLGGAAPQQHATIQASQASQSPQQRGIMANTMGGPHQTQMQQTQPPGPLQRQMSHRPTPAQGPHSSQSAPAPGGQHAGLGPQAQRLAHPQPSEQQQRFDAHNGAMEIHESAPVYSGDRQGLFNEAQHHLGQPHMSKEQPLQQQQQPAYPGPPQQSAYHSHAQAQSQMENKRQSGPSPLPVGGPSPGHQYPHVNAAVANSAELSSQAQALALQQQRIMLANRRSLPTGPGTTMQSNAAGIYPSGIDVNSNPPSPAKRFVAAKGGPINGNDPQAQYSQPPPAVNTSSPYANSAQGSYGSPSRPDQYGGDYQPVWPAPPPESSSLCPSADEASASFRRVASLPNPSHLNGASAKTNAASPHAPPSSTPGAQQANGVNGNSRSSSTTPRLQTVDPTIALQQDISRSQPQAHQLEGQTPAPALRNALTPSASAGGSRTPAATPGANGLVGAPETPRQYVTSPAMLQTLTSQTSSGVPPHATTSATTPGSIPVALRQSNTATAKRKREVAKEASAATKKPRAACDAIAKPPPRSGPNERKRSLSTALATTPANVALPSTPSPAMGDTPLPVSTPAPTGIVATESTETDPTPSGAVVASPEHLSDSPIFFNPATLEASDPISKLGSTTGGAFYTLDDGGSTGSETGGANGAGTGSGAGAGAMTSDEIDALFATSTNSLGSAVPDQGHFVDYTSFFNGANFDGFESFDLTA